jgi:glucose-1-phosphate thymidylyltransferase
VSENATVTDSVIIPPCFIEEDVVLTNAVIGPYVSISRGTVIENSVIKNSIIQEKTIVKNKLIENSMIGNSVNLEGRMEDLSIGDYNTSIQ